MVVPVSRFGLESGIRRRRRADLIVFRRGTVKDAQYLNHIIRHLVMPLEGHCGSGFIFIDANVSSHRAAVIQNELDLNNIPRLQWPSCSPDLILSKRHEACFGKLVYDLSIRPHTRAALEEALVAYLRMIRQSTWTGRLRWRRGASRREFRLGEVMLAIIRTAAATKQKGRVADVFIRLASSDP